MKATYAPWGPRVELFHEHDGFRNLRASGVVVALKPDLLVVSGHTKGATTAARQLSEMNVEVPLVAITHCESADLVGKFGKAVEGILCPTQWAETLSYRGSVFGSALRAS